MIREGITSRKLLAGTQLKETMLVQTLGVSRTPIREVLKRLERDGLVRIKPKSGTYVQQWSTRKIIELYQVRTYLECLAFRLALDRATRADVTRLARLADGFDRSLAARPFRPTVVANAHYRFHLELVKISRNDALRGFYERLHLPQAHMFDEPWHSEGRRRTRNDHHRIVQLLRRGDVRGERFVWKHLWENAEFLVAKQNSEAGSDGHA